MVILAGVSTLSGSVSIADKRGKINGNRPKKVFTLLFEHLDMLANMFRIARQLGLALFLLVPTIAAGQAPAAKRPDAPQLAPYVPTPQEVVERMLTLAGVGKSDVVFDLGCGDGRIPITAARKYGARGIGVDIDPQRIAEAKANAKAAGVEHLATFKLQDAMTTDVSGASAGG